MFNKGGSSEALRGDVSPLKYRFLEMKRFKEKICVRIRFKNADKLNAI